MNKAKGFIAMSFAHDADKAARLCVCSVNKWGMGIDAFGDAWEVITDDFGGICFVKPRAD